MNTLENNEFKNRIYNLRTAKGLSQKELADLVGVSDKAVSKWENGKAVPRLKTVEKAAEVLGVTPAELLYDTPVTPAEPGTPVQRYVYAPKDALKIPRKKASKTVLTVVAVILVIGLFILYITPGIISIAVVKQFDEPEKHLKYESSAFTDEKTECVQIMSIEMQIPAEYIRDTEIQEKFESREYNDGASLLSFKKPDGSRAFSVIGSQMLQNPLETAIDEAGNGEMPEDGELDYGVASAAIKKLWIRQYGKLPENEYELQKVLDSQHAEDLNPLNLPKCIVYVFGTTFNAALTPNTDNAVFETDDIYCRIISSESSDPQSGKLATIMCTVFVKEDKENRFNITYPVYEENDYKTIAKILNSVKYIKE